VNSLKSNFNSRRSNKRNQRPWPGKKGLEGTSWPHKKKLRLNWKLKRRKKRRPKKLKRAKLS
jgi:hypothetical protein